jgi:hypothetical protein
VRELRLQQSGNAAALDVPESTRPSHRIVVTRTLASTTRTLVADEETSVEPGDIIEVKRIRPPRAGASARLDAPSAPTRRNSLAADGRPASRPQ